MALKNFAARLDTRYEPRRQRLHGTVTAAPMIDGRSTGQLVATIGGIAGVRVNTSTDLRSPLVVGDGIVVEGVGSPAAMVYSVAGRISGARPNSDIYQYPVGGTVTIGGVPTVLGAGDIVMGSTLTDMSNWWYQYELGRWQIRKGALMHGAIGDLNGLYGYTTTEYGTAFGQYSAGQINITTDPTNGFRIRTHADLALTIDATNGIRQYTNNVQRSWFKQDGSGWLVGSDKIFWDVDGNVSVVGSLSATTIDIGGADSTSFHVDADGNLWSGAATYANGVFKVSNAGALTAAEATITGTIRSAVFEKSLVAAFAGSQVVAKSASTVAVKCTLSGSTFTLVVKPQAGAAPFARGDLIYIKTDTLTTYATVSVGVAAGENWSYTATFWGSTNPWRVGDSLVGDIDIIGGNDVSGEIPVGSTVIDYGSADSGRIFLTADATDAPFLSIATHDMAAPPVWTERVRLGNLTGIAGLSGYGLWTDNGYFTGKIQGGTLDIGGADTTSFHVDVDGNIWSGSALYADGVFKVNSLGELTATSGTIGGWTIGATSLISGSGAGRVGLSSGGVTNPAIWAGGEVPMIAPFALLPSGELFARSGRIGGWVMSATSLTSPSESANRVGLDTGGTNPAFYAGGTTPSNAPFRVTGAGALTALSGVIGGWNLSATALTSGTSTSTVGLDSGGTNPAFYAGSATPADAKIQIGLAGIKIKTSTSDKYFLLDNTSITGTRPVGFINMDASDPDTGSRGTVTIGHWTDADNQSVLWAWKDSVAMAVQKAASWRIVLQSNYDFCRLNVPLLLPSGTSTPTASVQNAQIYVDGSGNLVIQWNHGGVTRYKWLVLTDTSTTWQYSTSPP